MLRRLRMSTGLSQERLAERSGISANGIAALEAGRRETPRLNTVGLLADALRLEDAQRSELMVAATNGGVVLAVGNGIASRTDSADRFFVGRTDERQTLRDAWERKTKVVLFFGEAGVGKSTLADEFAADLTAQNVTTLRGVATQQQLGVYESFVEPVRTAHNRFDGKIPANLRDLGRLVPGLIATGDPGKGSDPDVDVAFSSKP